MKIQLSKLFIVMTILLPGCKNDSIPQIEIVKSTLDSAINENIHRQSPKEFYLLQDSIYKVLEEIEEKRQAPYPAKFNRQLEQLNSLIKQINHLRILNRLNSGNNNNINTNDDEN